MSGQPGPEGAHPRPSPAAPRRGLGVHVAAQAPLPSALRREAVADTAHYVHDPEGRDMRAYYAWRRRRDGDRVTLARPRRAARAPRPAWSGPQGWRP